MRIHANFISTIFLILFLLVAFTSVKAQDQKPELFVQTNHIGAISSIAYSPDGKVVATGGSDKTIKLWDVGNGKELRTLDANFGVNSLAFSPDGKILASGGEVVEETSRPAVLGFKARNETTIRLWDVVTGNELKTLIVYSSPVDSIAFSPDGKILASGERDKTIKFWDAATGNELKTLQGHSDEVYSIAFSPDGKTLASGSGDKTINLWDVATGKELKTLSGHTNRVNSVTFSPDGKTLASGSDDKSIKLWDASNGRLLQTFTIIGGPLTSVSFSPNGKKLVADTEGTTELLDVETGEEIRKFSATNGSVLSPDGKILAVWYVDGDVSKMRNVVKLLDVESGKEIKVFNVDSSGRVESVAFSPDGRTLASASSRSLTKLWDIANGKEFRVIFGNNGIESTVTFSQDGKMLTRIGRESTNDAFRATFWNAGDGKELDDFSEPGLEQYVFSGNGKLAVAWALNRIKFLRSDADEQTIYLADDENVYSANFSPDGKMLATGISQNSIKLWDTGTGKEIRTLPGNLAASKSNPFINHTILITFSSDGKLLASLSDTSNKIKVWDVATGKEIMTLSGHALPVKTVAFSPDDKTLASGSADKLIKLWDIATGKELKALIGHSDSINSVAFSPDGRTLASGSSDKTIRLWNISSGKELCSLIEMNVNDWLVTTPEGLFDGSPNAWKSIIWRFENNTFNYAPVEAYFNDFYYPNLLQALMQGKRPTPLSGKDLSKIDRRRPFVNVEVEQASTVSSDTFSTRTVKVKLEVKDNTDKSRLANQPVTGGAQDVRLFRNGSLVKIWRGDVLNGKKSAALEAEVPIVAGDNNFTAYAFNHDNVKSEDGTLSVKGADSLKRDAVLYVLAIGVNQYANSAFDLKYTVADAQAVTEEVKRQQERLKKYARTEIVTLFNEQASKQGILAAISNLKAKVQPEDGVLIYFSGHGMANEPRFYLIPHDLGYSGARAKEALTPKLNDIYSHSISDIEMETALEGLDAGMMLLIIDACNSGQALEAEEKRRGPMNSKGLAQLAYEKGMYVLTASQSYEVAFESKELKHSYLNFALIDEGLKSGKADYEPKDGNVLLKEWLSYAVQRVPVMRQEQLNKTKDLIDEEQKSGERVQQPRLFYRRENELVPFIVGKTNQ